MSGRYRIGVDIGGTFTDFVLIDTTTGALENEKVLTTPQDPSEGVLTGIARLLARTGRSPADALPVIHGTTLVANALIERKGVTTALVTTQGFRDIVEIGREWRYDIYDLTIEPPRPLVPRQRRFEVAERIGPDGAVIAPLDEAGVSAVARKLASGDGVASVAVSLLHAYRNPAHERRVRQIFTEHAPGLRLSLSSDVAPEIGEYERTSTTIANAYVQPIFERYLARLSDGLARLGLPREIYLMLSDGGTVDQETARLNPIRLVQSGPAGGVEASALFGRLAGLDKVIAFDMGGTTAKACLIEGGEPARAADFEVARVWRFRKGSGLPLKVPVVDMIEIGAGGGSIAWIDQLGLLCVGPESSSAEPGPACYGRGGTEPTVTDADLVLGHIAAESFLGGDMTLDVAAARRAIETRIARPLGLTIEEAAAGIAGVVAESMAQAASIHALEKAKRISDYALVAIGGAGPVHVAEVARRLAVRQIISPLGAGVASALGFLSAPLSLSFVEAGITALATLDLATLEQRIAARETEGRKLVAASGQARGGTTTRLIAAMRYVGQGHEVEVAVPRDKLVKGGRAGLEEAFLDAYRRLYGRVERSAAIEIVTWRIIVSGPRPTLDLAAAVTTTGPSGDAASARKGQRKAYFHGAGYLATPVYDRYRLGAGAGISGPAIIEEREATLVVPPGARADVGAAGSVVVTLG